MKQHYGEFVRPEDCTLVREARLRAALAASRAEALELRVFIRYRLGPEDEFDRDTGEITRDYGDPPAAPAATEEPRG